MEISVNTADLQAIATAFDAASSSVAQSRGGLAAGASQPDSASVIGSSAAAADYARVLQAWLKNLDQVSSSLQTMSVKVAGAARYYALTEAGNTVT